MTEETRIVPVKRQREEEQDDGRDKARLRPETQATLAVAKAQQIERTSPLVAPTMLFSGHGGAVYSVEFDPTGTLLASASFDKTILLWDIFKESDANYNILQGHKNAVLRVRWTEGATGLVSCSADKTVALWDANRGERKRVVKGHKGVVNDVCVRPPEEGGNSSGLGSASDDCTACLWDPRQPRREVAKLEHPYQVTSIDLGPDRAYTGSVDDIIRVWDLRKENSVVYELTGHTDFISGIALSPAGTHLLSNSGDSMLREWDIRPYAQGDRCIRTFMGLSHGADSNLLRCSWSPSGEMVTGGSADRVVRLWDEPSGQELYHLPGHSGTVNDVVFNPKYSVVASAGSDKEIYVGEI